jgi:hypothetical protein
LILLFQKFKKPILALNATRYESPYTFDPQAFTNLNQSLQNEFISKNLTVISNNLGDRDYLKYFTGIESIYAPSLCDYLPKQTPVTPNWIILSKNIEIAQEISRISKNLVPSDEMWPHSYKHEEFALQKGVIIIPYNISTMKIFELTTAGCPIRIPSDNLLLKMIGKRGILSELSYAQIYDKNVLEPNSNSPMDPNWENFYSWWLERADWNNTDFFPNITRFDSFEELGEEPEPLDESTLFNRNLLIERIQKDYLKIFSKKL